MLRLASSRARSTRPVLSETERSARRTGGGMGFIPQRRRRRRRAGGSGGGKPELLQFLAQGAAVDAENVCGAALVAVRVIEHDAKQRLLDLAQHHFVETGGPVTVQAGEVIAQGALGVVAQRQFPPVDSGDNGFASPRLFLCGHCESPSPPKGKTVRQAATAASLTQLSKCLRACANCAAVLAAPIRSRRISAGSSSRAQYQPRCLRAIRTPLSSP